MSETPLGVIVGSDRMKKEQNMPNRDQHINLEDIDIEDIDIEEEMEVMKKTPRASGPILKVVSQWLLRFPFVIRGGILFSFVGFFLAFFSGLFGGVSIWTVLWKTLFASAFFFFLGLLVAFILERFLGKDLNVPLRGSKLHHQAVKRTKERVQDDEYEKEYEKEDQKIDKLGSQVDYWESERADLKDMELKDTDVKGCGLRGFKPKIEQGKTRTKVA